jgi:hypothetical protein
LSKEPWNKRLALTPDREKLKESKIKKEVSMYVQIREMPGSVRQRYRVEFKQQPYERPTALLIEGSEKLAKVLTTKGRMRKTEVAKLLGKLDSDISAVATSEQCDLDSNELRELCRSVKDEELLEANAEPEKKVAN